MSYKNLEIWNMARDISIRIHKMTLKNLPDFEKYETGSQIRRSSKSIRANITEGYGRKQYLQDYIRFIVFAKASAYETMDHLETLYETGSLADEKVFNEIKSKLTSLCIKIRRFHEALLGKPNTGRRPE